MITLKHVTGTKKTFKTRKTMRQFLRRHQWGPMAINALLERGKLFGWTVKL